MSNDNKALADFLANTVCEGECMVWQGGSMDGYASDSKGKLSRRVFTLVYGQPRHNVCHTCDNRMCINPDHLYDGTQKQNVHDAIERGRFKFIDPETIRGQGNGKAKLSESQVRDIRTKWEAGGVSQQQLADENNISRAYVSNIVRPNGKQWAWLRSQ